MEVRGQEINDVRMSGGGGGGGGVGGGGGGGGTGSGRRDGNHNGTTTTTPTPTNFLTYTATQTLDHHHRAATGSNSSSAAAKPPHASVRYRECLRNHAASVGGNVYDGCGEFMPGGEDGSLEALKCAACDCHRNFHRKEIDGDHDTLSPGHHIFSPASRRASAGGHLVHALQLPPALPSPAMPHHHGGHHPHSHHHHHHQRYLHSSSPPAAVQPMSVAFGGSAATESSSEDLNAFPNNNNSSDMGMGAGGGGISPHPGQYVMSSSSKKRFRTKFTAEQKDRMMEFAEKVGWRINKQDEEAVERFCSEVGVRRQVFKVWMHNNKNVRKQLPGENPLNHHQHQHQHQHHHHHLNHHMRGEDGGDNGQQRDEGML